MNRKNISINKDLLYLSFQKKTVKELHVYAILVYMTSKRGYISRDSYVQKVIESHSVTKRTALRWLSKVHKIGYVNIKKEIIYPKSKLKINKQLNLKSKVYIKYTMRELDTYRGFRDYSIVQTGLIIQDTFRAQWKGNRVRRADSLTNKTIKIETNLFTPQTVEQCGCSISQVEKTLNLNKATISKALSPVNQGLNVMLSKVLPGNYVRRNPSFQIILKDITAQYPITPNDFTSTKGGIILKPTYKRRKRFGERIKFKYNKEQDVYRFAVILASVIDSTSKRYKLKH